MSDGIPPILAGDPQWRRLDARMLLVHPVQEAVRFLPALLVVFLSGRSSDRSQWWDLGILAIIVVLGIMRWFTTRYRIWGGQIELRQGLVNRRLLTTPADRVRTVDVTAPIWHRALGLARVEIGTAGGGLGAHRIVLDALAAPVAAQLRGELLHRVATADGPADVPADAPDSPDAEPRVSVGPAVDKPEVVLVRLDPAWVRYAPMTTSGLVSAAAIWGFSAQYIGQVDELKGRVEGAVDWFASLGVGVAALAGFLLALVTVSVLAMSGYVLTYWGFRLTRHTGGTLHI
ncbi:MAG TPA: PH domain-containing protein, partial [Dermatophilaceae bacterium]|nr:PH domain-containing protein [Dermatophilaceae bacterium]